jgi:hypothetical protein
MGSQQRPCTTPKETAAEATEAMADIGIDRPWHGPVGIGAAPHRLRADFALRLRRDGLAYIRHRMAAGTTDVPALLLEVAAAAYVRADRLNADLTTPSDSTAGMDGALPIACRAGCAACCHFVVEVTIPEAILVARTLADPAHPRRAAVLEAKRRFAGLDTTRRLRTGLSCPLLRSDRSCAVYDVRPLACRGFMAPDADRCHTALANAITGEGDDTIVFHALPQFFGRGYKAGISGICKDLGLQHETVELVRAVADILRDPGMVDRWAAGAAVFTPFGE